MPTCRLQCHHRVLPSYCRMVQVGTYLYMVLTTTVCTYRPTVRTGTVLDLEAEELATRRLQSGSVEAFERTLFSRSAASAILRK